MITISGLTKAYGKKTVLQDINLQIPKNKITFITGSNGSGKTTLLKCMLHLEDFEGDIKYENQPLNAVREKVFVIYDSSPLYPNLTGYQNIKLLVRTAPAFNNDLPLLDKILISNNLRPEILKKKVKSYSFGQKKQLSIMIALLNRPKFLFLDEVSNGLDYDSLMELQSLLSELSDDTTILAIGHHFEYYSPIIDKLIILNDRSAVQIDNFKQVEGGDIREIYKQYLKHE